jgi:hypothetical protein
MSRVVHAAFAIAATLAVGVAVVWGFVLAGSPATRRLQVLDERRVRDLKAISSAIQRQVTNWQNYVAAPPSVAEGAAAVPSGAAPTAPVAPAAASIKIPVTPGSAQVSGASQYSLKAPLPKTLDEVAQNDRLEKLSLRDPETEEPYDYSVVNSTTFKLCAKFSRAYHGDFEIFWNHPAGEHCFTINVLDPPP